MCVFHLHYYDLSTPKINDLRRREFDNEIKIVSSENGGLSYQLHIHDCSMYTCIKRVWSTDNYRTVYKMKFGMYGRTQGI